MRFFSVVALLALVGAVGLFAYQNLDEVTVRFWDREVMAPLAAVAGIIYLLGMLTGWSVLGIFRSTLSRVKEYQQPRKQGRV
jgi:lipopolysaccharide assembly protein A